MLVSWEARKLARGSIAYFNNCNPPSFVSSQTNSIVINQKNPRIASRIFEYRKKIFLSYFPV